MRRWFTLCTNMQFTKNDLKNGMVVELENNGLLLVMGNVLIGDGCWSDISNYNDDLSGIGRYSLDIIRVYDVCEHPRYIDTFFQHLGEVIWERKKTKEIPLKEAIAVLKAHYGCDIAII